MWHVGGGISQESLLFAYQGGCPGAPKPPSVYVCMTCIVCSMCTMM